MSTTFSLVVYVKPPHARPNRPSTTRIIPSVLFTAASFWRRWLKAVTISKWSYVHCAADRSFYFSSTVGVKQSQTGKTGTFLHSLHCGCYTGEGGWRSAAPGSTKSLH